MGRIDNVEFWFDGLSNPSKGSVVKREDKMTLDVKVPNDRLYHIVGKLQSDNADSDKIYKGRHESPNAQDVEVDASWREVKPDYYEGTWVQGNDEFGFSFEL